MAMMHVPILMRRSAEARVSIPIQTATTAGTVELW
jgi:hypothetical protein